MMFFSTRALLMMPSIPGTLVLPELRSALIWMPDPALPKETLPRMIGLSALFGDVNTVLRRGVRGDVVLNGQVLGKTAENTPFAPLVGRVVLDNDTRAECIGHVAAADDADAGPAGAGVISADERKALDRDVGNEIQINAVVRGRRRIDDRAAWAEKVMRWLAVPLVFG